MAQGRQQAQRRLAIAAAQLAGGTFGHLQLAEFIRCGVIPAETAEPYDPEVVKAFVEGRNMVT